MDIEQPHPHNPQRAGEDLQTTCNRLGITLQEVLDAPTPEPEEHPLDPPSFDYDDVSLGDDDSLEHDDSFQYDDRMMIDVGEYDVESNTRPPVEEGEEEEGSIPIKLDPLAIARAKAEAINARIAAEEPSSSARNTTTVPFPSSFGSTATGAPAEHRFPDAGAFQDRLNINDFPQQARHKVTCRTNVARILESTGVSITTKGMFYTEGKEPGLGDAPKLYLLVEGDTEIAVQGAMKELTRLLEEGKLDALFKVVGAPYSKYAEGRGGERGGLRGGKIDGAMHQPPN